MKTLAALLALFCSLPLAAADVRETDQPNPGTLFLHPERLALAGGGFATVERGMLFTRLVRADPESAIIGVEVYRFRADPGVPEGTPPIFQLHGGPGWPGLGDLLEREGAWEGEIRPMTAIADLVVVGQRGIGSSKPNTLCAGVPPAPGGVPRTPEEEVEAMQAACRACREHWESAGYDLRGFNVIEAAADVDQVRELLGYEKISLWGGSFGSHWGMAVMRYHPDGIARALLTGMEGPDHTYDMPSGILAALERMAGEAELDPGLLPHVPEGGLIAALDDVIASAEEEPIELEVRNPRTGRTEPFTFDAKKLSDVAMGYTTRVNSRGGVSTWPADVIRLARGDFEMAAAAWLQQNGGDGSGDLPTASFWMLDCGSGISPAREAELNADPAARIVGELGRFYQMACPAWGADLGDEFRAGFHTDIPTVIVHGTWDVSTPFENALELLPSFTDMRFVVVDTGSHGALGEAIGYSAEFRDALTRFLQTGDLSGVPEEVRLPSISFVVPN